eukprot:GHVS01029341.1.p1 GENE.GHVS01029341.1~~GHVS01029341.1.p1  ORF type:complete len:397 (+),score=147.55 GHVS01029341.1:190-1380(+)
MDDFDSFGFMPSSSSSSTNRRSSVPSNTNRRASAGGGGESSGGARTSIGGGRSSIGGGDGGGVFRASHFDDASGGGGSKGGDGGDIDRKEVERCVPVSIAIIEKAFSSGGGGGGSHRTLHGGGAMGAVSVVGWVMEVVAKSSQLVLFVADGTGCVKVIQEGGGKGGGGGRGGGEEGISAGTLVRVIGSVRAADNSSSTTAKKATGGGGSGGGSGKGEVEEDKENSAAGVGVAELMDGCLCVDACHLKVINSDYAEYAQFAPISIVFAATELGGVAKEEQEGGSKGETKEEAKESGGVRKEEKVPKEEIKKKTETWEAQWRAAAVVGYAHISDPLHCDVLRLLQTHPTSKDGGALQRTVVIDVLKHHHAEEDVDDALAVLMEEGEILEANNSYSLPM